MNVILRCAICVAAVAAASGCRSETATEPQMPAAVAAPDSMPRDQPPPASEHRAARQPAPRRQARAAPQSGGPSRPAAEDRDAAAAAAPPPVAQQVALRLRAAGVRSVTSKHLTLFTDLPLQPAIEELGRVFDAAVPQWCQFFSISPTRAEGWHQTAYLIADPELFRRHGALRDDVPEFEHGYQWGDEIWCYEQPSDYYRRHLLLHEGTHGFMDRFLRGAGPPWYMEGTAELLGTHDWQGGKLELLRFPESREQTPSWGRIKAIKEEVANGRLMSLRRIMAYDNRAHSTVEPYAWCWAAATFLHQHPLTSRGFAELRHTAADRSARFSDDFRRKLAPSWPFLEHAWQAFAADIEYGYDLSRATIQRGPSELLEEAAVQRSVRADRGWQSTGLLLEAGQEYRIEAAGRYQLRESPIWWSEANGVTIRYHRGFPLGALLATVIPEGQEPDRSPFLDPRSIGVTGEIATEQRGVLYLRVNDHPAELRDNGGELAVSITKI